MQRSFSSLVARLCPPVAHRSLQTTRPAESIFTTVGYCCIGFHRTAPHQPQVGVLVEVRGRGAAAHKDAVEEDGREPDAGVAGLGQQAQRQEHPVLRRRRAAAPGRFRLAQRRRESRFVRTSCVLLLFIVCLCVRVCLCCDDFTEV